MNILHIAPYISTDQDYKYKSVKSGFGYMVFDIANSEAYNQHLVSIFTPYVFYKGGKLGKVNILPWNLLYFFKYFSISNIFDGVKFIKKYKPSFKDSLKTLSLFCCRGYFRQLSKSYDIVHIHGLGALTTATINMCENIGKKYLVTLHGLISFEDTVKSPIWMKKYEKDFLSDSFAKRRNLSFISSGDRRIVCTYLNLKYPPISFKVISNGCNTDIKQKNFDVRKMYGIKESDFLFVYVGNISQNKNQIAVLQAYLNLDESIKEKTKVIFCGAEYDNGKLRDAIHSNGLENRLFLAGIVSKESIHNYYIASNSTILTSFTEGFGLSIIEGMVYGKPCVVFKDLSAIEDIGNSKAMIYPINRSVHSLAGAMTKMVKSNWNKEEINLYAQTFSTESMASKYLTLYKEILEQL